ncbi:MAG: SDR family NAD(P)-dependent oxidoreductase, partial [Acutalibacteraceae bacterium]|nr:SDR family NAD(P)-dependent oxidoreductase [Acutalibacteraceae bacterium]
MYLMLLVGGKIEILSDEVAKDGIRLLEKIRNTKFTIMQATPATWQMLLAADWNEKQPIKILCGGEALTRELADKLLSLSNEVWNMYGPTETTIWSMISKVEIGIPVNLGKPIRKTTIYILDENMNEVENGEIGELYIGGAGVAKGYIHNPQETKRRFIHYTKTNEIIYKTGDLVKILEDGNIAYVGRADFQVKINGFRIELGEIEDALLENKNLNQAVVVVGDKSKKLLAFLIAASGQNKPDSGVLVEQLEKTLPEYMVPKRYIYVDSYPLTLNRKVDRKQLAALDEELTGENQLSFESEKIEQKQAEKINDINELNNKVVSYICSVAAKIQNLPVETIKKDVNLGEYDFDSITFTNLCVNINKHYGIQTNPTIFYSYQTIEEFGKYLLQTFKENIKNVEKWDDESETEKKSVVNQSVVTTEKNIFTSNQRKIYDNTSHKTKNDIAVIGIAGVLPGSDNLEIFWDNLIAEKDLITEVPDTRWDWRKYFNKEENDPNRMTSKWGGFINDPDKFDAEFFKISPREAELIDPQQRLMIQVVWETFENAGYNPKTFSGREVGVFVGATSTDYMEITLRESAVKPHTLTGIANSIIPNRVSYLYNFMGPSEIIDTACSSGLVSICRAVDALNNGECECAIAGGVNLLLSPFTYIALGNSSMLSVDGSCKSFDERANGYVRGEGAAALLLKPLDNAISDGDNIYAVIKGTAVNHGGKANSITAPNPNAQCELIKKAYHKAGVDPSTVDYIETHGSGTALGDPIEINGLTMAFDDLYKEWGIQKKDVHCGLGAVKTNIGHLEAVSGVAGILKMILSMKHKKVPANIHFHKLNPYIHLENTPFFIRSETKNWENQIRDGKKVPLRGGVSSFGFGGTNAHVLVEEYLPDCDEVREPLQNEFIVPISAQYIEGIYLIAKNLLTYLHKLPEKEKTKYLLSRIAYTLQIGREAMKYRKVFVVSSVDDLETVLTKFTENDNKKKIGIFEAKEYAWENSVLDDSDVSFIVERYLKSGNINKLAKLWEAGIDIDWSVMYPDKVKKLPLPAYPFHKERFYLNLDSNNKMYFDRKPHPLIDETALEESLEEGIVFHKTLTYQDAVVREHVVKDNCVMPGTSYLEMALEGVGYINPLKAVKLSNVVWYQQLIVNKDKSQQISLNLLKSENGYNYKIQTKDPVKVIHGSGHIELFNSDISKESIDINAIKARCNDSINKEAFYKQIEDDADICYGSYFQGVKEIYENDSEVLGILELPEKVLNEQQFYYVHPVIMDCALQVMGRLVRKESGSGETKIPFSVEEIAINGSLNGEHYYVYVSTKMADIHNIYLLNENGEIQVFFKELVSRKIEEKQYFFVPRFEKVDLDKNRVIKTISHKTAIIYQDETKDFCQELEQRLNTDVIKIHINDREYYKQIVEQNHIQSIYILSSLVKNFDLLNKAKLKYAEEGGILNLFCLVKALQNISYPVDICVLTNNVYQLKDEKVTPINASLYSFSKSVMMENQNLNIRLYDLDLTEQADLSTELDEIIQHSGENEAYIIRESCWYERKIKRLKMSNKMPKSVCFKQRGTYLIVGMGGIGIEIGKYLASKYNASILFVSRSKINEERTKVIEEIKSLGGNAFYYQTDITDTYDVRNTMQKIKIDITNINGVILGAMVLKDMTIMSMTEKSLMDVVRPKAEGTIELFKELRKEQLDFVLFLSSVNALIGSPGQSNYCAACAIQDALADAIRNEIKIPVKIINWSYWGTVGAVSSNAYNQRLMNKGLYPIYEKEGMRVIEQVLAGNENQVCFCKASDETLQEMGFETAKVMKTAKNDEVVIRPKPIENKKVIKKLVKKAVQIKKAVAVSDKELENRAIQWIKEEFASLLKMDVRKLGNESNVEQIGIDSLLIIEIHKKWSKLFPQVPSTLLFEYNTIGKIAEYLLNQYQAELKALLVSDTEEDNCEEVYEEDETVKTVETEEIDQEVTQAQLSDTYILEDMKASDENFTVKSKENISYRIHKDIAIIGVSGMYPMADDIYEFWDNIKKGKDCTSTIPRDRWNWEDYFDPSNKEQGKSYSKWGGFLRNVKGFDAEFFGITKEQAKEMDPQERLLLESTWSTLEDAGYPGRTLSEEGKKVGVFLGTMYEGYNLIATKAWENGVRTNAQAAHWILPNKISHYFDFNGPSISFDTACASSMTALHYACRSIQNGDCSLALAGGINLILYPRQHVRLANLNSLSRSGKNMSFSQNADGYVEGEGVGTVLLKPLEDAIRDNDYIYGVVKASNVNCNGGVNTFTMPNLVTQSEVMKESLSQAALEPEAINYVEAHAAGTLLGDPVEVSALNKVFYTDTSRKNQCPIATVKANIGHVEAASGVAALTKVLLQMKYKKLVPSINCEPVSSMVPIENSAFYINKELRDWNVGEISRVKNLRRACINSNGAGGSNANMIVEEYVMDDRRTTDNAEQIIVISAKNEKSLQNYASRLREFLITQKAEGEQLYLADIAFTLQTGRQDMEYRVAFTVHNYNELLEKLDFVSDVENKELYRGHITQIDLQRNIQTRDTSNAEIARAWAEGVKINWKILHEQDGAKRIPLPTYQFIHKTYWMDARGEQKDTENNAHIIFEHYNGSEDYLTGHYTFGKPTLIGMTYVSLANKLLESVGHRKSVGLNKIMFLEPVSLDVGQDVEISIKLTESKELQCMGAWNGKNVCVCSAKTLEEPDFMPYQIAIPDFKDFKRVEGESLYSKKPNIYGKILHSIQYVYQKENDIWGRLILSKEMQLDLHQYSIHPILLDSAILCRMGQDEPTQEDKYIPFMVKEFYACGTLGNSCYCHIIKKQLNGEIWEGDVELIEEQTNKVIVLMKGVVCKKIYDENENRYQEKTISEFSKKGKEQSIAGNLNQKIINYLIDVISATTGTLIGKQDVSKNLMTIGCDSANIISLSNKIQEDIQIEIYPTVFFEYSSIELLAGYFEENFKEAFAEYLKNHSPVKEIFVEASTIKADENKSQTEENVFPKTTSKDEEDDPIAIIGIGGMFPQASDLDEFWENMIHNKESITTIPKERWDWREYSKNSPDDVNKTNIIWGGFLKDIDKFDADFFGISPREAKHMDPQQRVMLELAWHTIEDAGYNPKDLAGSKTGVFIGAADKDYGDLDYDKNSTSLAQLLTGTVHNVLTGRISYLFDFHGPSEPVDNACASSLVAIIHAAEAIQNGRCDMALAGGVHIMLNPEIYVAFDNLGILSNDGICRAFDKNANGTVRGEGAGLVLLKRLSKAVEDKDHIYAVLKGTGISHGGASNSMTAPNPVQQEAAVVEAFERGNVDPATVGLIETHGTGTVLGDPIEITALKNAFKKVYEKRQEQMPKENYCGIGAVKNHIGHLEPAAGIAGLLKILLCMKNEMLPGLHNFCELNPYINLQNSPFYIVTEAKKWERMTDKNGDELPYRAGISAFGFSGVNAHILLEEYREQPEEKSEINEQLIILSAKNEERLRDYVKEFVDFIRKNSQDKLPSLAT